MEQTLQVINYRNPFDIPADIACVCKGDGMINARIFDGDVVFIQFQEVINDGDIIAFQADDHLCLRRYHKRREYIYLEAENPMYQSLRLTAKEMEGIKVVGKVVFFMGVV